MTTKGSPSMKKKPNYKYMIAKCQEIIKNFNPVTHSVDTICLEHLGDVNLPTSSPENLFVQQIVYGWSKEKPVLKAFIDDYYADYAARVLRVDITLYTILAYMAIFRIKEMGWQKFKEICLSQEPSKIATFCGYIFNKENLWHRLRASWMRVRDLEYTEKVLIPECEKYTSESNTFIFELEGNAAANAAAEEARKEMEAKGEVGLKKVAKKASTRPQSPKLTKTRLPVIPEPERISQAVDANEVPVWLNNTSIAKLDKQSKERRQTNRETTSSKYGPKHEFMFHETKGGKSVEEVRRLMEEQATKDLRFDSSYVNPVPDFAKMPAQVRLNASTIYREDALYRKQQAKDAQILKNYEEELRDPTEFYLWQADLRDKDESDQLKLVALRREQARQSAVEAKYAMENQYQDNLSVASMIRKQSENIKEKKSLEQEIEILKKQEIVQKIQEVRDTRPSIELKKVVEKRLKTAAEVRVELEKARVAKDAEDKVTEAIKADRIMQLRAINTVHKKHIKVFDPTQSSGIGILDEISYMEMKERSDQDKRRMKEDEDYKRQEIIAQKQKRASDLQRRAESMLHARQVKADANQAYYKNKKEAEKREEDKKEMARADAGIELERDLKERREHARVEKDRLLAEQEMIRKKQQFLGAAMGQVEEARAEQMMRAKEREINHVQSHVRDLALMNEASNKKDRLNKQTFKKGERKAHEGMMKEREASFQYERKIAVGKIKTSVIEKKDMFKSGQLQHQRTETVKIEHNPYAQRMNEESLTKAGSTRYTTGRHSISAS